MSCELSQCLTTDSLSTTVEFLFSKAWQETPSISGEGCTSKRWFYLGHWDEQNFFTGQAPYGSPPTLCCSASFVRREGKEGEPQAASGLLPSQLQCGRGNAAPAVRKAKPHSCLQLTLPLRCDKCSLGEKPHAKRNQN